MCAGRDVLAGALAAALVPAGVAVGLGVAVRAGVATGWAVAGCACTADADAGLVTGVTVKAPPSTLKAAIAAAPRIAS